MIKFKGIGINLILGVLMGILFATMIMVEGYVILASREMANGLVYEIAAKDLSIFKIIAVLVFMVTIILFNTRKIKSMNLNKIGIYLILSVIGALIAAIEFIALGMTCVVKFMPDVTSYVTENYLLAMNMIYIVVLLGIAVFLLVFTLFVNKKVKYIKFLSSEVKVIKDEDFGKTIEVRGQDELAELCSSINNMSLELREKIDNEKKLTGFDVARRILDENNLGEIYVVETKGTMSDHYDPRRKTVRLSTDVYHGTSISSLAIAAHECGHAIQDKEGYTWFKIRSMIFPIVNIGQKIAYVVMIIGLFLSYMNYVYAAIGFTFLGLLFELVTLPVEFDASKRAKSIVLSDGMISDSEKSGVDAVLNSTAFTYVAAVISSMLEMLYLLMQLNDRD